MIASETAAASGVTALRHWLARPAWFGLSRGELLLYTAILVLAAVLRFYDLGTRALHHDESLHAKESFDMINGKQYRYDPAYHGPLQYFSNSALFLVFGVSDVTARVLPAFFGVAAVAALVLFRPELGKMGTPLAMLAMTLSTAFLYYSRFLRNDIYVAFFTLVLVGALMRYLARPRARWIYVAWVALGLSFATKENTFIHGVLLLLVFWVFVLVAALVRVRRPASVSPVALGIHDAMGALGRHAEHVVYGFLVFALIVFLFYTSFLTHLPGFRDAFVSSVEYWTRVHESERVNQPWFYYPMFMLAYEPFALLVGAVALFRVRLARNALPATLAIWAVAGTVVYSAVGEKAPWLVLHVLWPFMLLASWYAGRRLETARPRVPRVLMGVVVVVLFAWTVRYAIPATYERGDVPVDFVVYVQSSPDVLQAVEVIDQAARRSGTGPQIRLVIDNEYAWPMAWYLREYKNVYYAKEIDIEDARDAAIVFMQPGDADKLGILLPQHVGRKMVLRWWFPEYAYKSWGLSFLPDFLGDPEARSAFWDWLIARERPPVEIGTFDFWMYVRVDLLADGPLGPFEL